LEVVALDMLVSEDHRARVVWAFVKQLELEELYGAIKARGEVGGRPAIDPRLLLALWLYGTLENVGSARLLARLCESDIGYRWLCGGVGVNYHSLADFRVSHGALLDRLLTQTVAALCAEGMISLDEVAVDGTKLQAAAGRGSFRGSEGLAGYERAAAARVARLKAEIESNPQINEQRRRAAVERAEREVAQRAAKARAVLEQLKAEREKQAKTHPKETAKKSEPKASTTDPQARVMRFADGGRRPAYNLQLGCVPQSDIIVEVMATDRRNDSGLALPMVERMAERFGAAPQRVLVDTKYATHADIIALGEREAGSVEVYTPPSPESADATEESRRKRQWHLQHEPLLLQAWRARMASEQGKTTMSRRRHIETVNGNLKNRGLGRLNVRGLMKVQCVALIHALAHNLWRVHVLRQPALAT